MNSFRSSSADGNEKKDIASQTSLAARFEALRKPSLKKAPKVNKPCFWTQKDIPIDAEVD